MQRYILVVFLFLVSKILLAQNDTISFHKADSFPNVSLYLTVWPSNAESSDNTPEFLIVKGFDSSNTVLFSLYVKPIKKMENNFYLVKIDKPEHIIKKTKSISCKQPSYVSNMNSAGNEWLEEPNVNINFIKLHINSRPEGLECYLIPYRKWLSDFENKNWKQNLEWLSDYKVTASTTNTTVFIDETVYVVVCKNANSVKIEKHYTKPKSVEAEQTVYIKF